MCVYRALTQAITHDEALTWEWFASGSIWQAFSAYSPNNHVLHTLLVWTSTRLFGVNEFALRLPAMLGMVLFLVAALRLSRRAFGNGTLALIGLGLLTLNPLVLDYLVAARGYSLAMGFFLWGLLATLRWLAREDQEGLLLRASLAFGLSTVSHLTFALPSLAVAVVALTWAVLGDGRRLVPALRRLALPGGLLAAALWLPSILRAPGINYVYGTDSLLATSVDLVGRSLAHHETIWPIATGSASFLGLIDTIAKLAGLALLLLAAACLRVVAKRPRGAFAQRPSERLMVLATGALLFCLGVFLAAHYALGSLYPTDRWGLSLVLLGSLALTAALVAAWLAGGWRTAPALLGGLVLCSGLIQFVVQLQTTHFAEWVLDAGSRRFVQAVIERESDQPPREVRLQAMHWRVVPSLNFYRRALDAENVLPVPREWDRSAPAPDYLVVIPALFTSELQERFEIIDTDPVSKTSLAVPR